MPEYSLLTMISIIAVLLAELLLLRTGILRTARYWITMIIVWAFQIPVDGWLTKLPEPIVIYRRSAMLGIRFPWDIPVEDFGFGFSMVTLAIMVWEYAGRRRSAGRPESRTQTADQQASR